MRSGAFTILALLILTCVIASQSSPQDEMLEIKGVQLRLGMDENTVTQKLRERNFGVQEVSREYSGPGQKIWLLCESPDDKDCDPVLGEVGFRNGHVSIVTKRWTETNSAAEVEEVLLRHPGVSEVSVVGQSDPEWGEVVVAFVVPRDPGCDAPDIAELDALCLDNIARFKRPKAYRYVEALPKNSTGKVLKTELRKLL